MLIELPCNVNKLWKFNHPSVRFLPNTSGSLTHSSLGMFTLWKFDDSFGEVEFDLKSIPSPSYLWEIIEIRTQWECTLTSSLISNMYRYRISSCFDQQRTKSIAVLVLEKNIPLKLLRFYNFYRFHEYNRQEPFNYNLKPFLKAFFALWVLSVSFNFL